MADADKSPSSARSRPPAGQNPVAHRSLADRPRATARSSARTTATTSAPSSRDDVIRCLGSGLIRQLGPALAQRIADHFGDDTLDILDARPERVREVPGIRPQRAAALAAAWADHRALREVNTFLSAHGLNRRYAPRLVAAYGSDAPRVTAANPYRLLAEVLASASPAPTASARISTFARPPPPAYQPPSTPRSCARASPATRQARGALTETAARLASIEPAIIEPSIAQLLANGVLAARVAAEPTPPAPTEPCRSYSSPRTNPPGRARPIRPGGCASTNPPPPRAGR
ncbi:MAG: helix-hairpin-helix domain-containing protein [Thermomicrobiales bacterium]